AVLLRIFKAGDIVVGTEHFIKKFPEGASPLREVDSEIMLQPLVNQGALLDLLHPINIVIAAADDADHVFPPDLLPVRIQGGNGDSAGRFGHDRIFVVKVQDGGTNFSFWNEGEIVHHFPADVEIQFSHVADGGSVHKFVHL